MALRKPASGTAYIKGSCATNPCEAKLAVDGDYSTIAILTKISHWSVELEQLVSVDKIILHLLSSAWWVYYRKLKVYTATTE